MEIRSRLKLFCNSIDVNDKEVNFPRGINEYYVAPYVENDSCSYSLYTPVNHEEVFCVDENADILYFGAKCVYISCHLCASSACIEGRFSACSVHAECVDVSKCFYVHGDFAASSACFSSDVFVHGCLDVCGHISVGGYFEAGCGACIKGGVDIRGGLCITEGACIAENLDVGGVLSAHGLEIDGCASTGLLCVIGDLCVSRDAYVGGDIEVVGGLAAKSGACIWGAEIHGDLDAHFDVGVGGDLEVDGRLKAKSGACIWGGVEIEGSIGTTGCACIGGELKVDGAIFIDETGISGGNGLLLSGTSCGCVDLAIKCGNITIGCGKTTESIYFHKSTHFMEGCHIFYGFPAVSINASPGLDEQLVPKSYVDQLVPYHLEQTNSSAISGTGQTWKIVLSSYTGTNLPQITLYDKNLNIIHTDTNYNKTTKTVTFTFSGTVDFSAGDLTASILAIK